MSEEAKYQDDDDNNEKTTSRCPALIKSGDRKGQTCGKPSKIEYDGYCGVHKTQSTAVVIDVTPRAKASRKSMAQTQTLKSLFKWSGGKGDEIQTFLSHIPEDFRDPMTRKDGLYLEPFIGGGALFFSLMPMFTNKNDNDDDTPSRKIAAIGDVHPEMIAFYKAIGEGKSQAIYDFMMSHPNEEAVYYDVRDKMPINSPLDLAFRFYYQRKTCFRGMSRYNKSGHFNIPFGKYKTIDFDNLLDKRYEALLRETDVLHTTFETFFERYNDEKNFMFLDPPYDSVFTDYGYCKFGKEEHVTAADLFSY